MRMERFLKPALLLLAVLGAALLVRSLLIAALTPSLGPNLTAYWYLVQAAKVTDYQTAANFADQASQIATDSKIHDFAYHLRYLGNTARISS
jgi:hypothetical protein